MEDYLIREIDRIGELLVQIARRLGLLGGQKDVIPIEDVKSEITSSGLEVDIDQVLQKDYPVMWLVEQEHFSEKALETFTDILLHSNIQEETKQAFLHDATIYLDGKGYFSFLLHSYMD